MKQMSRITKTLVLIFLGFMIGVSCVITAGCGKGVPAISDNSSTSIPTPTPIVSKNFQSIPVDAICSENYSVGGTEVKVGNSEQPDGSYVIRFAITGLQLGGNIGTTTLAHCTIRFIAYDSQKDSEYVIIRHEVTKNYDLHSYNLDDEFRYRNIYVYLSGMAPDDWAGIILGVLQKNAP